MSTDALRKACQTVGGQAALARLLAIKPPSVNQWLKASRPIPAERCPAIERATQGQVTCEELRPDVDWGYLRATRCEEKGV